jgi:hypothetical protein
MPPTAAPPRPPMTAPRWALGPEAQEENDTMVRRRGGCVSYGDKAVCFVAEYVALFTKERKIPDGEFTCFSKNLVSRVGFWPGVSSFDAHSACGYKPPSFRPPKLCKCVPFFAASLPLLPPSAFLLNRSWRNRCLWIIPVQRLVKKYLTSVVMQDWKTAAVSAGARFVGASSARDRADHQVRPHHDR